MYEQLDVAIDDLLLDHENPRLGSVDSQASALRALVELNARNFRTMMSSIAEHGLDPGDLFYLVDESDETGVDGYTVIDGNRRLSALKVLREPVLLAGAAIGEGIAKRLQAVAEGYDRSLVGERRTCVLFANRGDAEDWILRRHGRNLEGEERIAWGPLEIQRFQGDRSVLDIIDFVERSGGYAPEDWTATRAKLDRKSYVLRRFLESKAGRAALGLDESDVGGDRVPSSSRGAAYLARVLKRLFDDVAAGHIDTRQYNKAAQIQDYFDNLPDELKPESDDAGGGQSLFRDFGADSRKEVPPPPPPVPPIAPVPPKARPVKIRNTLAPKQMEFKQPVNSKGQQFIREASRLNLKDSPLCSAFLLRGFIQFVIDSYMSQNNMDFWEDGKQLDLHVRADRVIDDLVARKISKRGELSGIRRRLAEPAKKHPSSIQALNDYHHDQYQVPDPDVLRTGWDDATALFVAVLGRAGK